MSFFFSQKLAWMQNWETYCSYEIFLNFKGHIDILTKHKTVSYRNLEVLQHRSFIMLLWRHENGPFPPTSLKAWKVHQFFFIFNKRKYRAHCCSKQFSHLIIINFIMFIVLCIWYNGVGASMHLTFPFPKTHRKYPING